MKYQEVQLHGFENPDTVNVGTDQGDIPEDRGTQLNLRYTDSRVFVVPHRNGQQCGDTGYIIEGRPEGHEIVKWYREEICGIEPEPEGQTDEIEPDTIQ